MVFSKNASAHPHTDAELNAHPHIHEGAVTPYSTGLDDAYAVVKDSIKDNIQARLERGDYIAETICDVIKTEPECNDNTECCEHVTSVAIEMELDAQEVVASAIDCGCDPLVVGNAAYNAGATLHDVYMAGGSTTDGSTGLSRAPDDVEQPTDRPASPFVPRNNEDKQFGYTD